ncbi:alpha-hydroxy-acid oxidizing enzyme [Candidimonas nitroreducens]|uniref:Alpha-hydroxy-acid oxidizing enzyme n=2 Tax=Candidimonas nitroreducens TaxID=683354 RepID=A0A225MR01_9BURK|nr:alpha-hydroxy acid oxidase [Candidimonas nitroreducens]OWT63676.1 alpha-hydroxy-acid oxidizing enzyme [Candidimonas nitroreducens]
MAGVLCLDDFESQARKRLPRAIFGYISGAAETNASLQLNRDSFRDYAFVPNALVDVSKRSQEVTLFGKTYAAPIGMAPMGLSALFAYRGDLVLAQAAARAGIPMIMSGSSLIRLEEVAQASKDAWFQAYLPGDPSQISALIARVALAGFETLVVTVDTPVQANRENNVRSGFSTPLRPTLRLAWDGLTHARWLCGTFLRTLARHGMPHFENNYATRGAPILSPNVLRDFSDRGHLTWDHLREIRRMWRGALVIKGILNKDDAVTACRAGVDGIIVSNHGGRQLDGSVAPLRVLPSIVDAARDIPVMIDSGVRRGTDVLKAIGLGARMAFVGRPFAYAAAVAGEPGAAHGIKLLQDEILRDMGLLGIHSLSQMGPERLVPARPLPASHL